MAPIGESNISRSVFKSELVNPIGHLIRGDEVHALEMFVWTFVESEFGAGPAFQIGDFKNPTFGRSGSSIGVHA